MSNEVESLYKQVCNGNLSVENQLFSILFLRFEAIARKRIWNKEDAEEVVQEALKAVSDNYKNAELKGPFVAWAHKVLLHKIWDYYGAKKRQSKYMTTMDSLDLISRNWTPDPTLEREILKCMHKLLEVNPRYGRLLILVYQGYSAEEICETLGISKGNCYTILSRARSMIKSCLQKGDFE